MFWRNELHPTLGWQAWFKQMLQWGRGRKHVCYIGQF